jgi:TIGR03009 family protein
MLVEGITNLNLRSKTCKLVALLAVVALIAGVWTSPLFGQAVQNGQNQTQQSSQQQTQQQYAQQQQYIQQQAAQLRQQPPGAALQQAAAVQQPQRPFPELSAKDQKYLEHILDYWQQTSQQVKQYECDFQRFEYDTAFVDYRDPTTNQLAAAMVGVGTIRFAQPDKARYETTELYKFTKPGEEYKKVEGIEALERWITDGKKIYDFDFKDKRIYETEIPVEMRGPQGLDRSPIPFLFGANKSLILNRYWVRVIQPKGAEKEYWLEAYPKRAEDAQNYSRVEIILDEADFLPKGLHMYSPQYDPKKNNFSSRYISFQNRKVNNQLSKIQNFMGVFVRPQLPIGQGWKRVPRMNPGAGKTAGEQPMIKKP